MLYRNYVNIQVLKWIDDNHFVGTVDYRPSNPDYHSTNACYGWSKGGSFFIYMIEDGHIQKLGTVKRHVVLDGEPEGV